MNIAAVFTEGNGTVDYSDLRKNNHEVNSVPQNISSIKSEEFDYVPSMKTSQNPEEKKIDNTPVYTPFYYDNSKINFNTPPPCFEDISDFNENEDEKEQISNNKKSAEFHCDANDNAAFSTSLNAPPNTMEQPVSKTNADMHAAKERPKVKHKRADNKPSGFNYFNPSRFDSAVMANLNIQYDNEEDEYFH